jgi:hypothetical protein
VLITSLISTLTNTDIVKSHIDGIRGFGHTSIKLVLQLKYQANHFAVLLNTTPELVSAVPLTLFTIQYVGSNSKIFIDIF